ncbi:MAG TPA: DUF3566 domain-containing protein [Actinocrinis sp.]|nr:DUF3566 domain-containing protein [Actinocrinis sp.]
MSESSSQPAGGTGETRSYGPSSVDTRPADATMSLGQSSGGVTTSSPTASEGPQSGPQGGLYGAGQGGPAGPGAPAPQGAQGPQGPQAAAKVAAKSFARLGSMVSDTVSSARPVKTARPPREARPPRPPQVGPQVRVRKARLRVARVDPWSVMKVSFVLSIAMGIVTMVATAVIWKVLQSLGVFSSLNKTIGDLTSSGTGSTGTAFSVTSFASFSHVEMFVIIISLVDIVLITALSTLGAYLYNLASGFVGGFEVTLAEDQ